MCSIRIALKNYIKPSGLVLQCQLTLRRGKAVTQRRDIGGEWVGDQLQTTRIAVPDLSSEDEFNHRPQPTTDNGNQHPSTVEVCASTPEYAALVQTFG